MLAAEYLAAHIHDAPVWIVPCLEGGTPTRTSGSSLYPAVQNMLPAAIRHLESGAQKLPNDPTVLYHLGMAYKQSGDWNKARVALKQALTINPGFESAS